MIHHPVAEIGLSIQCVDPSLRDLAGNIDAGLEAGVDVIELPAYRFDIVAGGRILTSRLKHLTELVRGRGARYTLHGHLIINLMDDASRLPLHEKLLEANIAVAAELGAVHLVIHTGIVPRSRSTVIEDAYKRQREALSRAGDAARDAGVVLCVENIFDYEFAGEHVTALPGRLADELIAIDHPNVKATFDFSHGLLNSNALGANFVAEARALAPHARHLHVHDSFGIFERLWSYAPSEDLAYGVGDLHLPLGWGTVPFDDIARECRFPNRVIVDIELQDRYWCELHETIAATRTFASRLATDHNL